MNIPKRGMIVYHCLAMMSRRRLSLLFAVVLSLLACGGCARVRTVTIMTRPEDANVKINGVNFNQGPVTHQFTWKSSSEVHRITIARRGYEEQTVLLGRDDKRSIIEVELQPLSRRVDFAVEPVPALLKIDGKPVTSEPVSVHSQTLQFTVDRRNNWTTYTVTAEREGFQPAEAQVTWTDQSPSYTLRLRPLSKDLHITSSPAGAIVYLDDSSEPLGTTPLVDPDREFPYDIEARHSQPHTLRLSKAGFDDVKLEIGWDEGKTDYHVNFAAKQKIVRITSDPPGATIKIEGANPQRKGVTTVYNLEFPPDEQGQLRTYRGTASLEAKDGEWEPATFAIGWDNGREDYHVTLREIVARAVPLVTVQMRRNGRTWECVPREIETLATRDTSEPSGGTQAEPITRLASGSSMGSMAIAPDGSRILFTVLSGKSSSDFRSQMFSTRTDGTGTTDVLTNGKTLDITPTYSPGGDRIIFSSNRAGKRLQIWSMSARGDPGITRLTSSESHDLWPSMDSDPKPRLFYQAMLETRDEPRIYMTPIGTIFETDLTTLSGTQPRVSPRNNEVLFCAVNEESGKRDIYRMSDRGGEPQNLTNTPDVDECDPVWSRDGRRIAFASDRALDRHGRRNYDIWILDLARPREPVQITTNGSVDDNPLFSPTGDAIYFRSNRGREWGIWKIGLR